MLHKLRTRAQSDEGFTLIELLVVILIIGILAAIALPAFLGQRQKAQDANAKTVVRTAATAAETYYTDSETYSGMTSDALRKIEPTLPPSTDTTFTASPNATNDGYSIEWQSKSGTKFKLTKNANGSVDRKCTGTSAGCKGGTSAVDSGTW